MNLTELETLAKKATPGPYVPKKNCLSDQYGSRIFDTTRIWTEEARADIIAYFASVPPETILALVRIAREAHAVRTGDGFYKGSGDKLDEALKGVSL